MNGSTIGMNPRPRTPTRFFANAVWILSPILYLILAGGCDNNVPESYQPEPNVFCVLRTDQDTVLALVGMSVGFTDTLTNPEQWQGVSGASVSIDTIPLREVKDSPGSYRTDSLPVRTGKTYSLTVKYPDGKIVTGTTVIPDTFAITSLSMDTVKGYRRRRDKPDTLSRVEITLDWGKSGNAKGYLMVGGGYYKNNADSFYVSSSAVGNGVFPTDSTSNSLLFPLDSTDASGTDFKLVEATVQVWALDANYYDYSSFAVRAGRGLGGGSNLEIPALLDGGLGVFGSARVCAQKITFPGEPKAGR